MLANPVGIAVAYLLFGLITTCLARGGWDQDWDESLLASLLGPPLFALITAAVVVRFLFGTLLRGHRPADLVSHFDRKRLADHRLARAADRPGFETDPGGTRS
jgi:phosphoglycerol transferase MdoB-like AlkP superfamily enzyme